MARKPLEFPPGDDYDRREWWGPLEGMAVAVAGQRRYRFFDIDDFMLMGRIRRSPRPSIFLYKHYYTRRYLNLDSGGHAYRYIPPKEYGLGLSGRYVAHRNPSDALDALRLWELPWMKGSLEHERRGLSVDEMWRADPAFEGDPGWDPELEVWFEPPSIWWPPLAVAPDGWEGDDGSQ